MEGEERGRIEDKGWRGKEGGKGGRRGGEGIKGREITGGGCGRRRTV